MSKMLLEAQKLLRKFGAETTTNIPSNPHECAKLRHETLQKMRALNAKASVGTGRDFTEDEQAEWEALTAVAEACSTRLNSLNYGKNNQPVIIQGDDLGDARDAADTVAGSLHAWMRNPKMATDTPLRFGNSTGFDSAVITQVDTALPTYFTNDAFRLAGATVFQTENTVPLVQPIISAGSDFADFSEGSSATDSAPMEVDSFTFGGTKHARLVKVSEEALMNSSLNLPGDIVSELGASLVNTITAAATSALKTALQGNSACFVSSGLDHYDAMLSLTLAPPLRFQSPANKFMISRSDLKRVKNVRSTQNEPLFDPTTNTILGYGVVLNDGLDRIVFGNWQAGAYIRKTNLVMQRLIELYSANGYTGFKMTQWTDQKFLASVHAVTTQPLFYTNIETAGS
jgi:HK97 family phage major capsid protein